jgi:hypothetical protein
MVAEMRRGSFVSAKSSSIEELRKVGGTWDLSREPEENVRNLAEKEREREREIERKKEKERKIKRESREREREL